MLGNFAGNIIDKQKSEAYGSQVVHVSLIQFGKGHLMDGVASDAEFVIPFCCDTGEAKDAFKQSMWQRGFTDMAQAILNAHETLLSPLRHAANSLPPGSQVHR